MALENETPLRPPEYLTTKRQELLGWLKRNAPSLAELYEGAVRLIFDKEFPGRFRLIAHAIREIRNRLPDVIAGTKGGRRVEYVDRMDKIAEIWEREGFSLGIPVSIDEGENKEPSPSVKIPRYLFQNFGTLINDHVETREKSIDKTIRLFKALNPTNKSAQDTIRPIALEWLKITNWFVGNAHDCGRVDAAYDEKEMLFKLEVFESTLISLVGEFFKTSGELDEILEETNI
jgi:hypothetical protein